MSSSSTTTSTTATANPISGYLEVDPNTLSLEAAVQYYLLTRSDEIERTIRSRLNDMNLNKTRMESINSKLTVLQEAKAQITDPSNDKDVTTFTDFLGVNSTLTINGNTYQAKKDPAGAYLMNNGLYTFGSAGSEVKATQKQADLNLQAAIDIKKAELDAAMNVSQREQTELNQILNKYNQTNTLLASIMKQLNDTDMLIIQKM